MADNYSIEYLDNICVITFHGQATRSDVEEIIEGFAAEKQPSHRLWDLSAGIQYVVDDIRSVAEYANTIMSEPAKIAIVAPSGLAFGASRVHSVYRESENTNQQVFKDRNTAMAWLKSQD